MREAILAPKFNYGAPRIAATEIEDDGTLVLVHDHASDGRGLDLARAERVLEYVIRALAAAGHAADRRRSREQARADEAPALAVPMQKASGRSVPDGIFALRLLHRDEFLGGRHRGGAHWTLRAPAGNSTKQRASCAALRIPWHFASPCQNYLEIDRTLTPALPLFIAALPREREPHTLSPARGGEGRVRGIRRRRILR